MANLKEDVDPAVRHLTSNMTVFEVIKKHNMTNIPDFIIPSLTDDQPANSKIRIRIKTIEEIREHYEDAGHNHNTHTNMKIYHPGRIRFYMVFDYNNRVKPECYTGSCEVAMMDSIAAISIPLPMKDSMSVDYWMELSDPMYKYVHNIQQYTIRNERATYLDNKIEMTQNFEVVPWESMLNSKVWVIPTNIREALSDANLIGGNKTVQKHVEKNKDGIPETYYEDEWVDGILTKLKI